MPATDPRAVIGALADAMNAHDIEAFVALFAEDYDSEQPAHPDRAFGGREQVRANWSSIFAGVPDVRAELVAATVDGDDVWAEWRWRGTGLDVAGVTIFGVRDGLIARGRLYMEAVEQDGEGIEAVVREMSGGAASGVFVSSVSTDDWRPDPEIGGGAEEHVLFDDGSMRAGLSRFTADADAEPPPWVLPQTQVLLVLEGAARIDIEGGPTLELGPGDMASLPKGAVTHWRLTLPFKELWVLA
jgi:quercetin dioxygenase-like cupin family protein